MICSAAFDIIHFVYHSKLEIVTMQRVLISPPPFSLSLSFELTAFLFCIASTRRSCACSTDELDTLACFPIESQLHDDVIIDITRWKSTSCAMLHKHMPFPYPFRSKQFLCPPPRIVDFFYCPAKYPAFLSYFSQLFICTVFMTSLMLKMCKSK